jgi:DUF1365 family protein
MERRRPTVRLDRACEGRLVHRRRAPVEHEFVYPVWMLLADVDRLEELDRTSRLMSVDRPNVLSLRTDDHLPGPGTLRERVAQRCVQQGVAPPRGPVLLLTQPRSLGFDFNPVSFFMCLDPEAIRIERVLAEVTNTPWNERHVYVLSPPEPAAQITCETPKALHVSPFNDMDLTYRWQFHFTPDALRVAMQLRGRDGDHFFATLDLACRPLDAAAVRRGAFAFPAQSIGTLVRIYRQAYALWRKGAPLYVHPDKREENGHTRIAD